MSISPFQTFYKSTNLSNYAFGDKQLIPPLTVSKIEICPILNYDCQI